MRRRALRARRIATQGRPPWHTDVMGILAELPARMRSRISL
jgi:hypothetical protein